MMTMKRLHALRRCLAGLTLIEIMVGLGVIAVLMAVAVPSMTDLLEKRRVIAAATEVSGLLTYAKAETNATNSLLYVRFDPDPNGTMSCAAVVTSTGLNRCRCYLAPANVCPITTNSKSLRLFQLPLDHVKFTAVAAPGGWAGGANYIMFSRDHMGIGTQGFRVNVIGQKRGYALRVEVNNAGLVKVCSPNGDMSGYATCV